MKLLVGCVGDHFLPGTKGAIAAAVEPARDQGHQVDVRVQPPITVLPYLGLATMRNRLLMLAQEEAYTHALLLDNDVLLGPATILDLLKNRKAGIVVPRYRQEYPGKVKLLEKGAGDRIKWAVFSCVLFPASVLERLGPSPFADTLCYCEEETTFQRWRLQGIAAFQAVTEVRLLRPPTNLWELRPSEMFRIKTPGDVAMASIR